MIQDVHPGSGSRILILIFTNPDPGCRVEKGTGSRIRNTDIYYSTLHSNYFNSCQDFPASLVTESLSDLKKILGIC
jgi:hypothetical protein